MLQRRTPLRRRTQPRQRRGRPRRGPERCPAYLAWIRTLTCAVCGKPSTSCQPTEAAHTSALGPRDLSQKSSDFSAIPLCSWHHRRSPDSYHSLGERRFGQKFGIRIEELVPALLMLFPGPATAPEGALQAEEDLVL